MIRSFNGEPVASAEDFSAQLRTVSPGDRVTLGIDRNGSHQQVQVTVTDQPS